MEKKILNEKVAEVIDKPHGRNFHPSKLSEKDVRQIRILKGKISGAEISKIFNVSKATVSNILNHITWKYLN
jgi:DNA-binding CsgD family transcriptional regulator